MSQKLAYQRILAVCSILTFTLSGCSEWGRVVRGAETACGPGQYECMMQILDDLEDGGGPKNGTKAIYQDMMFPGPKSSYMLTGSVAFVLAEAENVAKTYTPAGLGVENDFKTVVPSDIGNILYLAEMMIMTRLHYGKLTEDAAATELQKVMDTRFRIKDIFSQLDAGKPNISYDTMQAIQRANEDDDAPAAEEIVCNDPPGSGCNA